MKGLDKPFVPDSPHNSSGMVSIYPGMRMNMFFPQRRRLSHELICSSLFAILMGATPWAFADPAPVRQAPVRQVNGTIHGFLELRSDDGHIVASGDATRVVRGDRVTSRIVLTFKDGSVDDETTIFTQRRTFALISDHHIQKGPYFPHPLDTLIDVASGQVTVRSTDKDGKVDVKTDKMKLTPDLANGLVPILLENARSDAQGMTAPMIVFAPKPRLAKLVISSVGEDHASVAGNTRKATHYEIKIDLGGIAGVIAPIIGKAPPNIQAWTISGGATTFAKEVGPLYAEGPMMTIQLASPSWPQESKAAD